RSRSKYASCLPSRNVPRSNSLTDRRRDVAVETALLAQPAEARAPGARVDRQPLRLGDLALHRGEKGGQARLAERSGQHRLHDAADEAGELAVVEPEALADGGTVDLDEARPDLVPGGLVAEHRLEHATEEAVRVGIELGPGGRRRWTRVRWASPRSWRMHLRADGRAWPRPRRGPPPATRRGPCRDRSGTRATPVRRRSRVRRLSAGQTSRTSRRAPRRCAAT